MYGQYAAIPISESAAGGAFAIRPEIVAPKIPLLRSVGASVRFSLLGPSPGPVYVSFRR